MKRAKDKVDFEHPAQGPHHCSECRHFRAPHACSEVAGQIDKGDWCRLFSPMKARSVRADIERAAAKY